MTGTRNTQQDGSIQAMLRDSGLEGATELRSTLEGLQALVPDEAPAPRADLAALLASGAPAAASVASLADRRRGHKRRMALVGGAVVGAMSLGAGAVAASSQDFRENVGHTFTVLFTPAKPAPAPAAPAGSAPADIPAAPAPVPAGTSPTGTAPAAAVPAPPSPLATVRAPRHHAPAVTPPAVTPPAVGRGGVLPTPDKRPVVPGLPGRNGRGIPASPLPTVPALPELPKTSSGS